MVLWSQHVAYPYCRQCPACGCVFTFKDEDVSPGGGATRCQGCGAAVALPPDARPAGREDRR